MQLPQGSTVLRTGERVDAVVTPQGKDALRVHWNGEQLAAATVALPDGGVLTVRPNIGVHPILGPVHGVFQGAELQTQFSAVDLADPEFIPAMDKPGGLPSGGGSAILNWIALQAQLRGRPSLRYRGPYPTAALFDALLESFTVGDAKSALSVFVDGVEERSTGRDHVEVPVDFTPAPFERLLGEVPCQVRSGRVERAWVRGRSYSRLQAQERRLVGENGVVEAQLILAGHPWCTVATLTEGGVLQGEVRPPKHAPDHTLGKPLAGSFRRALLSVLPPRAPELMRHALSQVIQHTPMAWGDPGATAATLRDDGLVVHGGWLENAAGQDPQFLVSDLVALLEPVLQRLATAKLEAAFARLAQQRGG